MKMTAREVALDSASRYNSYDAYHNEVVRRARILMKGKAVCVDTISRSWQDKLSISDAALKVYDDTCYWEGP